MTAETFERLLAQFDEDPERAAVAYELARGRLIRVFRYRGCRSAGDLADEVFNRVARRIEQGERIARGEIASYLFGVARNVLREYQRTPGAVGLDEVPVSAQPVEDPWRVADDMAERRHAERRLRCLEGCLEKQPPETRALVVSYYEGQEGAKVRNRSGMAEGLGISLNSLRIRMHRIRERLERCVSECLAQKENG